jgi:hypothetical protein
MNKFIAASLILLASSYSYAQNNTQQQDEEEYTVEPSPEVINEIYQGKGGSPEIFEQVDRALKGYDEIKQYTGVKQAKSESFLLSPTTLSPEIEIEVTQDYITTITFVDIGGAPWPIKLSRVGNQTIFQTAAGEAEAGQSKVENKQLAHIIALTTQKAAGRSNLKVYFDGVHKPVDVSLVVRKRSYHDDVVINIPFPNPDVSREDQVARSIVGANIVDDPYARALIDGLAADQLQDAREMDITFSDINDVPMTISASRSIRVGDNIYLKVNLRSIYPEPVQVTPGIHGYTVYKLSSLPRIVSGVNKNGKNVLVRITDATDGFGYRALPVDPARNRL